MSLLIAPPTETLSLPARLGTLGVTRKQTLVLTAIFTLTAVVLFGLLFACGFDLIFNLSSAVRVVFLVSLISAVVLVVNRKLRPALKEPTNALAMAIRLEERFPKLNDALASAVDFETQDRLGSARFRAVAVTRAKNLLRQCEPEVLVPSGKAWRMLGVAVVGLLVTIPLMLLNTAKADLAIARLFDPFGNHAWPPQTTVKVLEPETFPVRLAKGESLTVKFRVAGVLPAQAVVQFRHEGETPTEDFVSLLESNEASITFDASRASRDFEVRVMANDADSGWLAVEVVPPPRLVPWDGRPSPRLNLQYPAYTKLLPAALPDGSAVVEAVAGTEIRILAQTDRPIAKAILRPQLDPLPILSTTSVAALANGQNPIAALASQLLAESVLDDIPLTIEGPQRTLLTGTLVPKVTGLHVLRFTDDTGITGVRLFDFRMYPDPAPTVTLARPNLETDVLTLLPTASINVMARADDRSFGLKNIGLEYRYSPDEAFKTLFMNTLETPAIGAVAGAVMANLNPNPVALELAHVVPLVAFTKANATPLADGDVINLRAFAWDWDTVTTAKSPGVSKEVEVRIASKATLEANIEKDLAALRPIVREIEAKQKEAREALANPLNSPRERLNQATNAQREVNGKLNDPREGVRAKVEAMRQLAKENNLPKSGPAGKAEDISKELNTLNDKALEPLGASLEQARNAVENNDAKMFDLANKTAAEKQSDAVKGIANVLEKLERWGSAAEVRGDAKSLKQEIQKAANDGAKANAGAKPEDVAKAADKINRAADDANELLAKAGRLAAEPNKPEAEANALREAIRQAGGQALAEDLKNASEAMKQGRTEDANELAEKATGRLDKFAQALAEKKPEQPNSEELKKKNKELQKELNTLKEQQDELRKKAKKAEENPNEEEKKDELKKLATEQKELKEKTEAMVERLKREGAERAAEKLKQAADEMAKGGDKLKQGEQPQGEQDEALKKLNETKKELNEEAKENKEELEREKQEEAALKIQQLKDRQAAALAEAKRLNQDVLKEKGWDRGKLTSLTDLSDVELKLAADIRALVEKEFKELPVFARLAEQASEATEKASQRILERKDNALNADPGVAFEAEAEQIAHARMQRPMALALARLEQILAAVKPEEPKKPNEQAKADAPPMPPPEGAPMPMGQQPPKAGIQALAQLKALRALQADLVQRTTDFHKQNPDMDKHTEDQKEEIRELEQGQREVAELFEKLLPLFQPMEQEIIP